MHINSRPPPLTTFVCKNYKFDSWKGVTYLAHANKPHRILYVCRDDAVRSRLTEALTRTIAHDGVDVARWNRTRGSTGIRERLGK